MSGKTDFTAEEWTLLLKSPMYAGLVVVAADPSGPIGMLKEAFALGKLIAETKGAGGSAELVSDLVVDLTTREGREKAKLTEIQGKKPEEMRAHALDQLKASAALVDRKVPAEAAAFKGWLQSVATRIADASKEGGFLGIGGTRVSEEEEQALAATASALGVARSDAASRPA